MNSKRIPMANRLVLTVVQVVINMPPPLSIVINIACSQDSFLKNESNASGDSRGVSILPGAIC